MRGGREGKRRGDSRFNPNVLGCDSPSKRRREPSPRLLSSWNAKPQPVGRAREGASENARREPEGRAWFDLLAPGRNP
jgi:hypothetical protein